MEEEKHTAKGVSGVSGTNSILLYSGLLPLVRKQSLTDEQSDIPFSYFLVEHEISSRRRKPNAWPVFLFEGLEGKGGGLTSTA